MALEIPVDRKLDDIFEEAYNLYNSFDDCNDPTNSSEFQVSSINTRHHKNHEIFFYNDAL